MATKLTILLAALTTFSCALPSKRSNLPYDNQTATLTAPFYLYTDDGHTLCPLANPITGGFVSTDCFAHKSIFELILGSLVTSHANTTYINAPHLDVHAPAPNGTVVGLQPLGSSMPGGNGGVGIDPSKDHLVVLDRYDGMMSDDWWICPGSDGKKGGNGKGGVLTWAFTPGKGNKAQNRGCRKTSVKVVLA